MHLGYICVLLPPRYLAADQSIMELVVCTNSILTAEAISAMEKPNFEALTIPHRTWIELVMHILAPISVSVIVKS